MTIVISAIDPKINSAALINAVPIEKGRICKIFIQVKCSTIYPITNNATYFINAITYFLYLLFYFIQYLLFAQF